MDLYITITDENGDQLERLNVYQDGSDSEGAADIADYIASKYSLEPLDDDAPDSRH